MSDISRRQLFRLRPSTLAKAIGGKEKKAAAVQYIRPPGAVVSADEFNTKCENGCDLCGKACPYDSISFLGPEHGRAEGTPVLSPKDTPCRWCTDFPCITACSSDALVKKEELPPTPISKAVINYSKCSNSYGELCDTCVITCPTSVRALSIYDQAVKLNADVCTGCGLCAYYCSEHNDAIVIKPLIP